MDIKKLEQYEYISFDIYDTLIKRNIENPTDIFKLIELEYNKKSKEKITDFVTTRINSEIKCRNESNKEITLEMIYKLIEEKYSKEISKNLKKIEKNIEINITQENNNKLIKNIYNWAQQNKKVILISDMYLPKEVIKKILKINNIKYNKLYLSSEIGSKKSDSTLFKYVLDDLNVNNKKIFHIGDNQNSDNLMANKVGINSYKIPTKINNITYKNKRINKEIKNNINYNILTNFINNNIEKHNLDCLSQFGYECFGPMLNDFIIWLKNELKKQQIRKVYFLARDGKIMKKIFDIYNTENKFESVYLMASRRSLIVPSLYKYQNIEEVFSNINIPKEIKLKDLLNRLGLDDIDTNDSIKRNKLDLNQKYKIEILLKNNKNFFEEIFPLIVENSKEEYKNLKKYLKSMNFEDKVAIVDIGWYGNMQNALASICNANIHGYYFGLRPNKKTNIKTKGYLFDSDRNTDLYNLEDPFNSIFEFIFSANHGSVKKFISQKPYVELYKTEYEESSEAKALEKIQEGAYLYASDYSKSNIKKITTFNEKICSTNMFEVMFHPNKNIAKYLGEVQFKDGEKRYIAKSKGIKKYIKNPKAFLKDLKKSDWKIAFLKNTFKIKLPYHVIYKILKKIK